jgi:hypothetical protein
MKLPNGERAVVDIRKLRDYCLSAKHRRGRHKARVFEAALGQRPRTPRRFERRFWLQRSTAMQSLEITMSTDSASC